MATSRSSLRLGTTQYNQYSLQPGRTWSRSRVSLMVN